LGAVNDATHDGIAGITRDAAKAGILDPDVWAQEGFDLAKQNAYSTTTAAGTFATCTSRATRCPVSGVTRKAFA
jgi:hypothetical protein